jgi:putative addiction module component (TIGR02574 family)
MPKEPAELLREALDLPEEARAALATSLLDSLETETDADAEERWREEIVRRLDEIDSGAAEMVPWDESRRRLWSHIRA